MDVVVGILNLELLSLTIVDLLVRDSLLVDLAELVQLLGCSLPQLHGLHPLLKNRRDHQQTQHDKQEFAKKINVYHKHTV